jgi:hypothetical protein
MHVARLRVFHCQGQRPEFSMQAPDGYLLCRKGRIVPNVTVAWGRARGGCYTISGWKGSNGLFSRASLHFLVFSAVAVSKMKSSKTLQFTNAQASACQLVNTTAVHLEMSSGLECGPFAVAILQRASRTNITPHRVISLPWLLLMMSSQLAGRHER